MLILRAFQIADGSVAADILPGLEGGLLDGPDLVAGVPSLERSLHSTRLIFPAVASAIRRLKFGLSNVVPETPSSQ